MLACYLAASSLEKLKLLFSFFQVPHDGLIGTTNFKYGKHLTDKAKVWTSGGAVCLSASPCFRIKMLFVDVSQPSAD
jgi:hypothetical protein